jgi:hypothetical protein
MAARVELNLPAYKRLGYAPDPDLVQRVKAAVYRTSPTPSSVAMGKTSVQDWIQRPSTPTVDTSSTLPQLNPLSRYETGLENLKNRPQAIEDIGTSFQNRTDITLQSGRDATAAVQEIMAAKQAQIEAKQQQRLMQALSSSRTATGAIIPSQSLPRFTGKINFNDYGNHYYAPEKNKQIALRVASAMGLSDQEFRWLDYIIQRESSYRNTVKNKKSTAYGIAQFLDGTWSYVGGRKTKNPALQVYYMIKYAKKKYGSIYKAYLFKVANGWY